MKFAERVPNYNKEPEVLVKGYENDAFRGYKDIINEINKRVKKRKYVITVDCYHGVRNKEVLAALIDGIKPDFVINSEDIFYDGNKLTELMKRNITEDRIFGIMYYGSIKDFIDKEKLSECKSKIDAVKNGVILIYGVAASIINRGDLLVYADMSRWEIQQRYRRKELGNFKVQNLDEDILRKYKRAFFIEWRVLDRYKKKIYDDIDYLLDTNVYDDPKMITGEAFRNGMIETLKRPFRVVPYFDPGVWGGQWLKKVCNLDRNKENFAWAFDCVPEENSLYLRYGDIRVEIPSINLVLYKPKQLLGERVYSRFGAEFPIRFDFLDTMDGGNLSLQVHPITEYIQDNFGMHYTQDESYYIMDAKDDSYVYLGLKNGVNKNELLNDLRQAQECKKTFDAEKYINKFHARKHDHFLIPAGTIHCSGKNCVVLEISATPYIFTFKLWDWGRVGLDGMPRPIHIEHGSNVIQWDRTTNWVEKNLINRFKTIKNDGKVKEERTGLHEFEFIETRRYEFASTTVYDTNGIVNVLNLVDGEEAVVESPDNCFEPYVVHYAETFIVPAAVGRYTIKPCGRSKGKKIVIIKAYVRC